MDLIPGTHRSHNHQEVTLTSFIESALALPGTEEALYYGKPSVKRSGKIMFSIGENDDIVSIKLDWDSKLRLLDERPEAFWITPHHSTWPWVLVRLSELNGQEGAELVRLSWQDAPNKSVIRSELKTNE